MLILLAILFLSYSLSANGQRREFLQARGADLYYKSQKVFLSGVNLPFYKDRYGYDFGNQNYAGSRVGMEDWIRNISRSGGNFIRVWLHCEGFDTPQWTSNGFVTAADNDGNIVRDLSRFLDFAADQNVFVMLNLWNGATINTENVFNLIWDDNKLRSYIDNALRPMVRALRNKPALAIWEIMNEPEGGVRIEDHSNPCLHTNRWDWGMGFNGKDIPMERFQKFVNWQAAAIHNEDRKALVSVGHYSEHSASDAFDDCYNYFKDQCLIEAGGQRNGFIDVFQMHTYAWDNKYSPNSPFNVNATDYKLGRPLIIGEFSSKLSEGRDIADLFSYAYNNNYNGVSSWSYKQIGGEYTTSVEDQERAMQSIRNFRHKGSIRIVITK